MSQVETTVRLPAGTAPPVLRWHNYTCESFKAEYAVKGLDLVYHFFPPEGHAEFGDHNAFARKLDKVFQSVFPRNAPVQAEFVKGSVTLRHRQSMLVPGSVRRDSLGRITHKGVYEDVTQDSTIAIQPHDSGNDPKPQDAWHITAHGFGVLPGAVRFFGQGLMPRIREAFMLVGR